MEEPANEPANNPTATPPRPAIDPGDVYWVTPESGIAHPCVVIQDGTINRSRVPTVVVVALTTNLKRASLPGNLRLEAGEANLPRASVVEVSKVSAVRKDQLGGYIGTLPEARVRQIMAGMAFVQRLSGGDG